jgi:hypothetical protein
MTPWQFGRAVRQDGDVQWTFTQCLQRIIDQTDKARAATINSDVVDVIEAQATAQREALLDVRL